MDKFPDDINFKTCLIDMKNNQVNIIKQIRKDFCDKIRDAVKQCHKELTLNFPDNLWCENRKILAIELFDRFKSLRVKSFQSTHNFTRLITNITEINKNIDIVVINFWKQY